MMKSWSEIREVSWGVLAIFLVAIIAAAAFVNLVFFRLAAPQVVVDATAGLVDWSLMGSAIILVVVVGGVIFGLGQQRPADVGLIARTLPAASGVTAALWVVTQALLSLGAWATLGEMPLNLFFAVGVHTLANQPLTLVQSDLATPLLMLLALGAAFFWRTSAPPAGRSAPDAV